MQYISGSANSAKNKNYMYSPGWCASSAQCGRHIGPKNAQKRPNFNFGGFVHA